MLHYTHITTWLSTSTPLYPPPPHSLTAIPHKHGCWFCIVGSVNRRCQCHTVHRQLWSADHFGVVLFVQVKVLVPNSTAGMIIGKSGNYIKQIKEESGAYVQISQKSKETNLPERCVTIAGEFSLCLGFVFRICNHLFYSVFLIF